MKLRKIKGILLSILCLSSIGAVTVACDGGKGVLFERRLWNATTADMIVTDNSSQKWEYSSSFLKAKDGTIQFRNDGDSITSEKFSTSKTFTVDITMSLNGGSSIVTNVEKDEFVFEVQALDANKNVVSTARIDELNEFPAEKTMEVKSFVLNTEKKNVSYVRLQLVKAFYKANRFIRLGVGRVKAYYGEHYETKLPDGIKDDYVSTVKYTNYTTSSTGEDRTSKGITLQDLRKSSYDLTPTGNQNVLVVPVKFADTTEAIFPAEVGGFDGMRKIIEQAYFGADGESGWESLSSYNYKSSYGKLNIKGKVTPWYTFPGTVQEFYDLGGGSASVYELVDAVSMWYKTNYDDYRDFDLNNDGYFDCIQLIYAQNNCSETTTGVCNRNKNPQAKELFWAFTWKRAGSYAMKNWPNPYTFVWLSYDFLLNENNVEYKEVIDGQTYYKADAHTVIHENGHALGLLDYYSTGYDGSTPAGRIDMMDNNVGDHNSYSKWQYNWTSPVEQIVYDETNENTKRYEVTLRPFEKTGDFVIIPAYTASQLSAGEEPGNLDSPLAEYITIEYYTPTGLNYQDSLATYDNTDTIMMTEAGIKMYHVDSRLAYLGFNNSTSDYSFSGYVSVNADKDTIVFGENSNTRVDFPHHNDGTEQNYDSNAKEGLDFRMLKALLAQEADEPSLLGKKARGHMLNNADLWGSKTSQIMDFGKTNHTDFTFNNEFKNLYSMEIVSINENEVKLVFEYKA